MKRYLALDIGRKRTGIAVTDTNRIISTALETVETHKLEAFLKDYISKNEVEKVIVGMPVQMNNQPSESVKYILPVLNRLKKVFPDIEFISADERFTSKMAFQTMIDAGLKKMQRQEKETVDKISAAIILQSYLDSEKYKNL
ncbi:MAG: Holliday junction resolvase RuvX [Bacteroidales bacterium]|jgi:putative Holliday junction resolvase|nr:Holliday junction resolvase RuvX [Bacteroidales bacterium]